MYTSTNKLDLHNLTQHRPASLLGYDKVLVLDNGSVVEKGNPSELLASETGVFVSLLKKKP